MYFFLFLSIFITAHSIYVNENNNQTSPDGSRDNPYATLEDAVSNFTPDDSEIIILGDSVTLGSSIFLPPGTVCTIRPDTTEETEYFPWYFAPGGALAADGSNLTIQNFRIIELDKNRPDSTNPFQQTGGVLTLNKTWISDIDYRQSFYYLIFGIQLSETPVEIRLIDSHFENLNNVQIYAIMGKVYVSGCYFDNIDMKFSAFILLYQNTNPDTNLTVLNSTIVNSKFDYKERRWQLFLGIY